MIIDFTKINKKEIANFKDGEGVSIFYMFEDERNKIFKLVLNPSSGVGYHKHEGSQEIMYLLEGEVMVNDDENDSPKVVLKQGQVHYCKDNHFHSVKNVSDKPATLICTVTMLK